MASGFSDGSDYEFGVDEGNEAINFDVNFPLDLLDDTGIEADISNELSNVALSPTNNDSVDSDIVNIDESYETEPLSSTLDENDANNSANPPKNRKVPQKRKPVCDFKKIISSTTMKNRLSNRLVGCLPQTVLPNKHHKSVDELFRSTAHHGSIAQKMFDALKLKPVQKTEPEWDCLNEILGLNAMDQIMNGDNDRRANRTLDRGSSIPTNRDSRELLTVRQQMPVIAPNRSSTPVPDDDNNVSFEAFDDDAFLDHSTIPDAPRENSQHGSISTLSNIFSNESAQSKIIEKLRVLWANDTPSISMKDLVSPGFSRFAAAKVFYTLLGECGNIIIAVLV